MQKIAVAFLMIMAVVVPAFLIYGTYAWGQASNFNSGPNTFSLTATANSCSGGQTTPGCVDWTLPANVSSVGYSFTGTWTGTISVYASVDHGKTTSLYSTFTSNTQVTQPVTGDTDLIFQATSWSGTATVSLNPSTASSAPGSFTNSVSNGQWVQPGDIIWFQHTTQDIGTASIFSSFRILNTNGTVTTQNWTNSCAFSTVGGWGTGYQVVNSGWLQAASGGLTTGGFPQGTDYAQIYLLTTFPSGGGPSACVSTCCGGGIISALLAGGPIGSSYLVSFLGTSSIIQSPWSIPGYTEALNVGSPSAGADFTWSIPGYSSSGGGSRTCIMGLSFQLVTSSTASNRYPGVIFEVNNGTQVAEAEYVAATAQTASTTEYYTFSPGSPETVTSNGRHIVPFNNGSPLCLNSGGSGGSLNSYTAGIESGDQYSAITLIVQIQQDND